MMSRRRGFFLFDLTLVIAVLPVAAVAQIVAGGRRSRIIVGGTCVGDRWAK